MAYPFFFAAARAGALAALCACSVARAGTAPSELPSTPARSIDWTQCDGQVDAVFANALGRRLRCATVTVPLDHHHPEDGDIALTVLRVDAGDPALRQGALFFNPGGPGGDVANRLAVLAAIWQEALPDDPVHGEKKRLSNAFDLIAVVPRGMHGSGALKCDADLPEPVTVLADQSAGNLALWDLHARRMAEACLADPKHRYITTEQTVYDLDVVRRAMGESTFNFYGISYGTWMGVWYGATFPERVGRMILDSPMDFTVSAE